MYASRRDNCQIHLSCYQPIQSRLKVLKCSSQRTAQWNLNVTYMALVESHGALHLSQFVLVSDVFVRNDCRPTLLGRIAVWRQSQPCILITVVIIFDVQSHQKLLPSHVMCKR